MALGDYSKTTYVNGAAPGISAERLNRNEDKTAELDQLLNSHLSDYVRQPAYAVTTGTANTYAVTLSPAPTSYVDGMGIVAKIIVANTGAATINVNSLGAKAIVDSKGNAMAEGKLKSDITYSLKYNSSLLAFQLLGEGGDLAKIPNLVKNGSFESGINCWVIASAYAFDVNNKKFGTQSIVVSGDTSLSEVLLASATISYTQGHKYYVASWVMSNTAGVSNQIYFPLTTPNPFSLLTCTVANTWYLNSFISDDATIVSGNYQLRLDNNNMNAEVNMFFDGVMVLDLTAGYGAGNEPSKAEMDAFVQANGWWDSDLYTLTADATATGNQIVAGYFAYTQGTRQDGVIPSRPYGSQVTNIWTNGQGNLSLGFPTGAYITSGGFGAGISSVAVTDPTFIPSNISSGISMFGLAGTAAIGVVNTAGNATTLAGVTVIQTQSSTLVKAYEKAVRFNGTVRFYYQLNTVYNGQISFCQIYRNGIAVGTAHSTTSESGIYCTDDIAGWKVGDLFQMYMYGAIAGNNYSIFNLYVRVAESYLY